MHDVEEYLCLPWAGAEDLSLAVAHRSRAHLTYRANDIFSASNTLQKGNWGPYSRLIRMNRRCWISDRLLLPLRRPLIVSKPPLFPLPVQHLFSQLEQCRSPESLIVQQQQRGYGKQIQARMLAVSQAGVRISLIEPTRLEI